MTDEYPNITPDEDSPSVIGATPSPMPTEADRQLAWDRLYVARWVAKGFDEEWGMHWLEASDWELTDDPEASADDDMEYLDNE